MKLKKYLTSLLAMVFFASCSNDGLIEQSAPLEAIPEDAVAFNVSFPGRIHSLKTYGDPVPFTNGTVPAEDKEKSLDGGVKIYVFDNKMVGASKKPQNLISVEEVKLTSDNYDLIETTTLQGKFFLRKLFNQTVHLVAVANVDFSEEYIREKLMGKSFETFANTLVTQEPGESGHFPMVSIPQPVDIPVKVNSPINTTFELERLAVRIDIINETTVSPELLPHPFLIKGYTIPSGSLNQSYLIHTLAEKLSKGDDKGTLYRDNFEQRPLTQTGGTTDKPEYKYQIYTYENRGNDFVLQVIGSINGAQFNFDIPFDRPLVRNTIYKVRLKNDADTKRVSAHIEVVKWQNGGESLLDGAEIKTQPSIVKALMADEAGAEKSGVQQHVMSEILDSKENTQVNYIKLNHRENYNLRLVVKSSVEVKFDDPALSWIKVESKSPEPSELVDGEQVKVYHLKISKNEDGEVRKGALFFYTHGNKEQTNLRRKVVIEQPKTPYGEIVNPLGFFSNRFVDRVNEFAKEVATVENMSDPNVHGKWYQWGRNVPLALSGAITVPWKAISQTSSEVLNSNTWYGESFGRTWFTETVGATDTWEKMVEKAPVNADYKGKNGGDPSPKDPLLGEYKIPTTEQLCMVFPSTVTYDTYYQNKAYEAIETTVQVKVGNETSSRTYKYFLRHENNSLIFYAITLQDLPSAPNADKYRTAIRYEFLPKKGLKVTARHIGADPSVTSVNQIANDNWWNVTTKNKAGSDVVRFLPFSESRGSDFTKIQHACNIWGSGVREKSATYLPVALSCEWSNMKGYRLGVTRTYNSNAMRLLPIRIK